MDATRQIVRVLRETSREAERDLGVSGAQLFVLQRLQGGPLTINELAEQTATHQTSVSVVVQRLVDAGLVTRRVSKRDRRRREVALTVAGRRVLSRAPDAAQERLIRALRALASGQRRELARTLSDVVAAMGEGDAPAPMFFEDKIAPSGRRTYNRDDGSQGRERPEGRGGAGGGARQAQAGARAVRRARGTPAR